VNTASLSRAASRPRSRSGFHALVVTKVERLTSDSAAVTFAVPDALSDLFAFSCGQFLTIRRGAERRSYSICSPVGAAPRIGVREVAGGAVSGWLIREVKPGDVIEVAAPMGTFTPDLSVPGRHVLVAAGSGITPLMSIAASVLAADARSAVTLLYGNRHTRTVMFADEIADLKDAYPARLQVIHVLSREPQEVELHSGRLDRERLAVLAPAAVDIGSVDHWWLCGPHGMISDATGVLGDLGVPAARIHRELFWAGDEPPAPQPSRDAAPTQGLAPGGATVTVTLDGRSSTFTLPAGTPVLDGAQQIRPDLPFACKGGVCGTCRAKVTHGATAMRRNYALEPSELAADYVLTCQAIPTTDDLTIDYDSLGSGCGHTGKREGYGGLSQPRAHARTRPRALGPCWRETETIRQLRKVTTCL
jgi:ring-1,2-phenylacetyl-CoA epoxidase subunit PaaE